MKDLHQSLKHSLVKNVCDTETSNKTKEVMMPRKQWIDLTETGNNPKIDTQLLSEFHRLTEEYDRLTAPIKDVVRVTEGADYNLSHPLASKDRPTDAYHLGKSMVKLKEPDQ